MENKAAEDIAVAASGSVTTAEILEHYMAKHVEGEDVADKVRQRNIMRCLLPHFGPMTPADYTPSDPNADPVQEYRAGRADGSIGIRRAPSASTHRRELNMLIAAFNYAVKTKFRRLLPTDVPYIALPGETAPRDIWLNEVEEAQYLAAARAVGGRGGMFVNIALGTASRRKAIELLEWSQIDLDVGMIHFNPPGRSQTKKRRVPVAISNELFEVLVAVPPEKRRGFVLNHSGSIDRALQTINRRAFRETGNKKFLRVTPHVLRHTWATLAARRGVDLYQIAGVLGDTLATVTKNYLHHCPEHLRSAVNFRDVQFTPARRVVDTAQPEATP